VLAGLEVDLVEGVHHPVDHLAAHVRAAVVAEVEDDGQRAGEVLAELERVAALVGERELPVHLGADAVLHGGVRLTDLDAIGAAHPGLGADGQRRGPEGQRGCNGPARGPGG